MNIGFVSTWLERGAAYVTRTYMRLLEDRHSLFVYARGGEYIDRNLDSSDVTYGLRLKGTEIDWHHFSNWIRKKNLDIIFFNEQSDFLCLYQIKKYFPQLKIGAYIDYYKEDTVKEFAIYDFLICNTKRHYSVFSWHPGAFYVPWGTDLELFSTKQNRKPDNTVVFFHSMGMSPRKGTDCLISAYINGEFYHKNAKLLIHTQVSMDHLLSKDEAEKYNIDIIEKTVSAPGLYHLADVYVYPATLDGLGLTMYEALACGLPVIATNTAPMNEIITDVNGKLVSVEQYRTRKDAYYWPLAIVDESSLITAMQFYIDHASELPYLKENARQYAEEHLNVWDRKKEIQKIFEKIYEEPSQEGDYTALLKTYQSNRRKEFLRLFAEICFPNRLKHHIRQNREKKRNYGIKIH